MKIITWNVNGLRAALSKGIWEWLEEQNGDVICLQEIKTRPDQLKEEHLSLFRDTTAYWHPAERPGYSGVASILKEPCLEVTLGLGDVIYDIEGRVIQTKHAGFRLFNVYFPNGQRDQGRLAFKLDFYAYLLAVCDALHARGESVVICGDFNTAHREIDLRNPTSNATTSGFLPEERAWIDRYLEHGLVDVFRMLYPDRVQYTWWTYLYQARKRNIGWRLDYFLVSTGLVPRVKDVIIHDDILGSDHCPVTLLID
jgi:exodeoxyribonuclease-3